MLQNKMKAMPKLNSKMQLELDNIVKAMVIL